MENASQEQKMSLFGNAADLQILIAGAGGLGCEIIKNLAASGFRRLTIIDMDKIEVTNLNRQLFYTSRDVGEFKAEIAAKRIMEYMPEVDAVACVSKVQDMPVSFYEKFQIVVSGLDNIDARRHINEILVMNGKRNKDILQPFIDGGSGGFQGQCRVILPNLTPCLECTISLMASEGYEYPLCTLASIPRLPEHCIQYVRLMLWPQHFDREPDLDSRNDVGWLYRMSVKRAREFGILGVTLHFLKTVLKRIVPAIASTNAIIAGACCVEVWKIGAGQDPLDNYFMYNGENGAFGTSFKMNKLADCLVCGCDLGEVEVDSEAPFEIFLLTVANAINVTDLPSVTAGDRTCYMSAPVILRELTEKNLKLRLCELLENGEEVAITHKKLQGPWRAIIKYSEPKTRDT